MLAPVFDEETEPASVVGVGAHAAGGSYDAGVVDAAVGLAQMSPEIGALKAQIIADIEERLARKEESLWRRGQVEIKRLQQEQEQVKSAVEKLQANQISLVSESQKLRGALVDVTTKFEVVVSEMREVLRALPQAVGRSQLSPVPSLASTATSDVGPTLSGGCDDNQGSKPTPGGFSGCNESGVGISSFSMEETTMTSPDPLNLCTPPRLAVTQCDESLISGGPQSGAPSANPVATPSPPVLSLASALQSTPPQQSPGTGCKQLNLSECLEQQEVGLPVGALATSQPSTPERCTDADSGTVPYEELVCIEIVKEPGFVTLGIEVNEEDACLMVEGIDLHGLVARHNANQDSDPHRLLVGDRIVEVNGVRQDPGQILIECKAKQHLSITVARYIPGGVATRSANHSRNDSANSPPSMRQLRPDAEVFVPSAQKDAAAASQQSMVKPPGLGGVLEALEASSTASAFPLLVPAAAPGARSVTSIGALAATVPVASDVSVPPVPLSGLVMDSPSEAVKRMLFK
jgi:hypothetical protein